MRKYELMATFVEKSLGRSLSEMSSLSLSGWDAVEALWPLNERFQPHMEQIRSLPYDPSFAGEADIAIESLLSPANSDWNALSSGAWRVLLERQQQGIVVALANEHAGNSLMSLPVGLSAEQTTVVVALFLLHGMELPWPPEDRSGLELPPGSARASLRRH